jgi:hypothetical protein
MDEHTCVLSLRVNPGMLWKNLQQISLFEGSKLIQVHRGISLYPEPLYSLRWRTVYGNEAILRLGLSLNWSSYSKPLGTRYVRLSAAYNLRQSYPAKKIVLGN